MTPQDRLLALRTFVLGMAVALVTLVVMMLTDEIGSGVAERLARLSVLIPAAAAIAAFLAVAQIERRGELAALSALGARRARATLGAVAGGWLMALVAIVMIGGSWSAPAALFPTPARGAEFRLQDGELVETSQGVRVDSKGELRFQDKAARPDLPPPPRWGVLLAVASLGISAPLWGARITKLRGAAYSAGATVAIAIVLFHAVAAGRIAPYWLVCCGVPLGLYAWRDPR